MASNRKKYSESEKGKGIQSVVDSPRSPKLMDSAIRAQSGVSVDPVARDLDQIDIADGTLGEGEDGRRREGDEGGVSPAGATNGLPVENDRIDRSVRPTRKAHRSIPFRYCRDGSIEQLPDLPSELCRPSIVEGQNWGDVIPTTSTRESVRLLLEELGAHDVVFIVPRPNQRPWTPPIGYYCVYESFFGRDSKLWFPIPRLITTYCARRDVALTQLMIGAIRIAVALMVMAAEINISMSVRVFEELTQTQPKPNGLFAVQMRAGLHILTGHPSPSKQWQRSYFYVRADEAAFEDPPGEDFRILWNNRIVIHPNTIGPPDTFWEDVPKIVTLSQQRWGSFDRQRIDRQRGRIAKGSRNF